MSQAQESNLKQSFLSPKGLEAAHDLELSFDVLPPFPKIFSFQGRINRSAFVLIKVFVILTLLAALATYEGVLSHGLQELFTIATPLVHGHANRTLVNTFDSLGGAAAVQTTFAVIFILSWWVFSFSAEIRRAHDFGISGWGWVGISLFALIPFAGYIILLISACTPGNPESNKYGDPPKPMHLLARAKHVPRHLWRGETPIPNMLFFYLFF